MKYEISSILLMLAFLFGIASFSTTTYGGKKLPEQTNTGSVEIQESKGDRKENLQKTIQTIGNKIAITQSSVSVVGNNTQKETTEKSENIVKNANKTEQIKSYEKSRTPEQIYEQVKHLGYRESPTISLITTCKGSSLRPDHCIIVGLTLMYNEAGNQQKSKACVDRNNCFGIQSGKKSYSSLDEGMENWVQKYNKYWYKAENAGYFYSRSGKIPPSRYCTSEDSSGSSIGCPTGLKIASDKWEKLHKIIY